MHDWADRNVKKILGGKWKIKNPEKEGAKMQTNGGAQKAPAKHLVLSESESVAFPGIWQKQTSVLSERMWLSSRPQRTLR